MFSVVDMDFSMFKAPEKPRMSINRWGRLKSRAYKSVMMNSEKGGFSSVPIAAMIKEYKKELFLNKVNEECAQFYFHFNTKNNTVNNKIKIQPGPSTIIIDKPYKFTIGCDHSITVNTCEVIEHLSLEKKTDLEEQMCTVCNKSKLEIADQMIRVNGVLFLNDDPMQLPEMKSLYKVKDECEREEAPMDYMISCKRALDKLPSDVSGRFSDFMNLLEGYSRALITTTKYQNDLNFILNIIKEFVHFKQVPRKNIGQETRYFSVMLDHIKSIVEQYDLQHLKILIDNVHRDEVEQLCAFVSSSSSLSSIIRKNVWSVLFSGDLYILNSDDYKVAMDDYNEYRQDLLKIEKTLTKINCMPKPTHIVEEMILNNRCGGHNIRSRILNNRIHLSINGGVCQELVKPYDPMVLEDVIEPKEYTVMRLNKYGPRKLTDNTLLINDYKTLVKYNMRRSMKHIHVENSLANCQSLLDNDLTYIFPYKKVKQCY